MVPKVANESFDVAVVGLGPVGSAAAVLLADRGLSVVAVERDEEVYRLPRAVNLDGEIIRAFQPSNRAEHIDSLMQTVREGERAGFANSARQWMFGQPMVEFGLNGWQPMNMFDQPELEGYLRQQAIDHPNIQALIGAEVRSVSQSDELAELHWRQLESSQSGYCHAAYLLACDGAASPIRRQLGIGWSNLGYDREWLVVDVIVNDKHTLTTDTMQVCDPDRLATYVCTKDPYRRWEFRLNPGESREQMLKERAIRRLINDWTPEDSYEIRRAAVYQFHAATADRWRDRRILLAGDAAHQTPPFLGQGMNTGMRDIINLAWKIPMVVKGTADDTLLDTYFAERCAHARDLIDWAVSIGQLMEHLAAVERAEKSGEPPPVTPEKLHTSGYGQGREQPPIRDGVVMRGQVNDTGLTGYLLPQPIVQSNDSRTCRLDDLFGEGFTLISMNEPPELTESDRRLIKTLNIRVVILKDLTPVRGKFHKVFLQGHAAIVRPDRIVFGQTNESTSLSELLNHLAAKLSYRTAGEDK